MLLELFSTALFAVVPAAVGVAIGRFLPGYRRALVVATGLPAAYFLTNLLVALSRQGLRESVLFGITLGNSPVFVMVLSAIAGGLCVEIAAGSRITPA